MLIDTQEAERALATYDGWEVKEGKLSKLFLLPSFLEAIAFVNKVSTQAGKAEHYPKIEIQAKKVGIVLTTAAEGGITEKDIKLAKIIDDLT